MGQFWSAATEGAGREFGRRYWRWFAGIRVLRRAAPGLVAVVIAVSTILGYRWLAPDWPAIGARLAEWTATAGSATGSVILWMAIGLTGLAAVFGAVMLIRRSWWRWSLGRPLWMRRY
jgi:NAD/NADP transhydrogenase alpha subunit